MKPPKTMTKPSEVRVLGIDPGFDRLGLAVVSGNPASPTYLWSTCITPKKGASADRLAAVFSAIEEAVTAYTPTHAAIETLFFSKNRKTALAVAEARGVILAALGRARVPVMEYSPAHIKIAVTGHGGADKTAVMQMIPKLISLPGGIRTDDEYDAIAAAITGLAAK